MRELSVFVLRPILVLLFLGGLLVQLAVIPQTAAELAVALPGLASLATPYAIAATLVILCLQVALAATWRLLSKVRDDEIFSGQTKHWVDAIIAAVAVGTLLVVAVEVHLAGVMQLGPPALILLLTVLAIAGAAFVLLMIVMRSLLHNATIIQAELALLT